jgi:hypothetical protein
MSDDEDPRELNRRDIWRYIAANQELERIEERRQREIVPLERFVNNLHIATDLLRFRGATSQEGLPSELHYLTRFWAQGLLPELEEQSTQLQEIFTRVRNLHKHRRVAAGGSIARRINNIEDTELRLSERRNFLIRTGIVPPERIEEHQRHCEERRRRSRENR